MSIKRLIFWLGLAVVMFLAVLYIGKGSILTALIVAVVVLVLGGIRLHQLRR
jgi:hypothetical protein